MPSHPSADRPTAPPPEHGAVEALIRQAHRLRGGVDAVRREAASDEDDPRLRWQRALCDLAVHHLEDLGRQLGQLRDGLPPDPVLADPVAADPAQSGSPAFSPPAALAGSGRDPISTRLGSAEWNLLTDEVDWSEEMFRLFGRSPEEGGLTLDELPSYVFCEDQPLLTGMVTDCLVDGKPIDGEFRLVRPDGSMRTVHMRGEPVLDTDGCTASMWAVLRDVSELRCGQRAVRETRDSLRRRDRHTQTESRLAVELQEAVLPPWRGSLRLPHSSPAALDMAGHYLPSATSALVGGDWYDALPLPDGRTLLSVGDLTGHGVAATSSMAMLLGALRGMAVAGAEPGQLLGWLNDLLDVSSQPALGTAVCCRYDARSRSLAWAQAGHPAPLLFRDGTGRILKSPDGVPLGAASGTSYGQAEEQLEPGDLLVLHTDGLVPRGTGLSDPADRSIASQRLLDLAPRLSAARGAQECIRILLEEFGDAEREGDACVLVARIGS